jgi:hypothetical protein
VVVADDDDRPKSKTPAALEHLGGAGDMHHALVKLIALFFALTRLALPIPALLALSLILARHQSS